MAFPSQVFESARRRNEGWRLALVLRWLRDREPSREEQRYTNAVSIVFHDAANHPVYESPEEPCLSLGYESRLPFP
jgi:hypothetical protein